MTHWLLMCAAAVSPFLLHAAQTLWVFGPVTCVQYPLYEIEGDSHWGHDRRRTVLEVVKQEQVSELLYLPVMWKLLEDKWAEFAQRIFFWFVICNLLSLASLTLSLCTASEPWRIGQPERPPRWRRSCRID